MALGPTGTIEGLMESRNFAPRPGLCSSSARSLSLSLSLSSFDLLGHRPKGKLAKGWKERKNESGRKDRTTSQAEAAARKPGRKATQVCLLLELGRTEPQEAKGVPCPIAIGGGGGEEGSGGGKLLPRDWLLIHRIGRRYLKLSLKNGGACKTPEHGFKEVHVYLLSDCKSHSVCNNVIFYVMNNLQCNEYRLVGVTAQRGQIAQQPLSALNNPPWCA